MNVPALVADMDIVAPVVRFLRSQGIEVLSALEEGWGNQTDRYILCRVHALGRFARTHDADFGMLAVHQGEPITGILYLRPGGRPPDQVIVDLKAIMASPIEWAPPMIAV